jgi:hypothetical protein
MTVEEMHAKFWFCRHFEGRGRRVTKLLCILIAIYALFCILFANWHSPATLIEVFPYFGLSYKADSRLYVCLTKTRKHSS